MNGTDTDRNMGRREEGSQQQQLLMVEEVNRLHSALEQLELRAKEAERRAKEAELRAAEAIESVQELKHKYVTAAENAQTALTKATELREQNDLTSGYSGLSADTYDFLKIRPIFRLVL